MEEPHPAMDPVPSEPATDPTSDATLARRISHDLNNLLLAIHLNLEGIRDFVPPGAEALPLVDAGLKAVEEARAVVRELTLRAGAAGSAAGISAAPAPAARRERILAVEDNELVRKSVWRVLTSLGYDVVLAASAAEALDHITSFRDVDLLFSDVRLSGAVNGVALAHACRAASPGLPVLLTSGFTELAGAEAFPMIVKPYTKSDLDRHIRDALGV